jgi:hypothetical protein
MFGFPRGFCEGDRKVVGVGSRGLVGVILMALGFQNDLGAIDVSR